MKKWYLQLQRVCSKLCSSIVTLLCLFVRSQDNFFLGKGELFVDRYRLRLFGTPRLAGVFGLEKRPTGLAGGSPYAPVRLSYQQRPNRRIWVWHLHFCYLPPVNGLPEYGMDN